MNSLILENVSAAIFCLFYSKTKLSAFLKGISNLFKQFILMNNGDFFQHKVKKQLMESRNLKENDE